MAWPDPNSNQPPFPDGPTTDPIHNFFRSAMNQGSVGAGVDHTAGGLPFMPGPQFMFGQGPWGGRGRRGRGGRRHCGANEPNPATNEGDAEQPNTDTEQGVKEKEDSPETLRGSPEDHADGPSTCEAPHAGHHHWGGPRRFGCRGGFRAHHGPHGHHGHHGHHGPHGHRGPHGPHPPPPYSGFGPFPFGNMVQNLGEAMRDFAARSCGVGAQAQDGETFTPPADLFNTETAYVIHVALPGAKKEDIGVNWDADKSVLEIAGVVYRPGDEEFLQTLASSERKIGMFERTVTLPPHGVDDKDEIDGMGISARMEDGILIITVPKVEKEWTEVHKVDIE